MEQFDIEDPLEIIENLRTELPSIMTSEWMTYEVLLNSIEKQDGYPDKICYPVSPDHPRWSYQNIAVFRNGTGAYLMSFDCDNQLPDINHQHFIIPYGQSVPTGLFEVTDWSAGTWAELPPVITPDMVKQEADRRLSLGFDYDFGDGRGNHHIGTTDSDMAGWREVTDYASALVNTDDTISTINIVTDTGPTQVTGSEWLDILKVAATFRQPIWAMSFALQAQDTIPADYADDSHWT